jgi:cellulose synthase/poly-beta-1,6-N-acetylglucosamine synthase-like glycosyltransferase
MSFVWLTLLSACALIYVGFVLTAVIGIWRLHTANQRTDAPEGGQSADRLVSIVIAARNEEAEIGKTLKSLMAQKLPRLGQDSVSTNPTSWRADIPGRPSYNNPEAKERPGMSALQEVFENRDNFTSELTISTNFEIIVVDDRSADRTAEIVTEIAALDPGITLIQQTGIPPETSPKKEALKKALAQARGQIIVTTDADCRHPQGWLQALVDRIPEGGGMVVGQARFDVSDHPPLWQRLQALDFAVQGMLSAGLASAGSPFNCSGASLAYSRAAYERVGGFAGLERFISGDDELLMRKFIRAGIPVAAASGMKSVVTTRPPSTPGEMWRQRARWGSKTIYYPFHQMFILSGVFLFYLCLTLSPVIFALGGPGFWAVYAFLVKLLVDLLLFFSAASLFGDNFRPVEFLLAEILHPPVIVLLAVNGVLGKFEWKGAIYRSKGGM